MVEASEDHTGDDQTLQAEDVTNHRRGAESV
jgi:hypothetical protein